MKIEVIIEMNFKNPLSITRDMFPLAPPPSRTQSRDNSPCRASASLIYATPTVVSQESYVDPVEQSGQPRDAPAVRYDLNEVKKLETLWHQVYVRHKTYDENIAPQRLWGIISDDIHTLKTRVQEYFLFHSHAWLDSIRRNIKKIGEQKNCTEDSHFLAVLRHINDLKKEAKRGNDQVNHTRSENEADKTPQFQTQNRSGDLDEAARERKHAIACSMGNVWPDGPSRELVSLTVSGSVGWHLAELVFAM